jgi:hypothetical protein
MLGTFGQYHIRSNRADILSKDGILVKERGGSAQRRIRGIIEI